MPEVSGTYKQSLLRYSDGAPIVYSDSKGEAGSVYSDLSIMPETAYSLPAFMRLEPEFPDSVPEQDQTPEDIRRISVGDLHAAGAGHDERIYGGLEDEDSFPTRMYYLSWRNDELYRAASEVRQFMVTNNIADAADIPDDMKRRLIQHYVDFEIACKTAISELGFDPVELRQRTLAYRERKYDTRRMAAIREEIRLELMEDPTIVSDTSEEGIDAEVKRRIKRENASTSRMDTDIHFADFETSYEEQQRETAEWENAFTNGRGQDLHGGLDQLMSELNESQQEVLRFFEAYTPGAHVQEILTRSALYEMAAEIDDVGVAGLSMLNKFGVENVSGIFEERLKIQNFRFAREIVHAYYQYYGDMRYALEATRRTGGAVEGGQRYYQMNYLIHPALRGCVRDADVVAAKVRKYSPVCLRRGSPDKTDVSLAGPEMSNGLPRVDVVDKDVVPDYPLTGDSGTVFGQPDGNGGYMSVDEWRAQ